MLCVCGEKLQGGDGYIVHTRGRFLKGGIGDDVEDDVMVERARERELTCQSCHFGLLTSDGVGEICGDSQNLKFV